MFFLEHQKNGIRFLLYEGKNRMYVFCYTRVTEDMYLLNEGKVG